MDAVSTKAKAAEWHVTAAQVCKACREGKIPGAEQDKKGSPWRIPKDAPMPECLKKAAR